MKKILMTTALALSLSDDSVLGYCVLDLDLHYFHPNIWDYSLRSSSMTSATFCLFDDDNPNQC